MNIAPEGQLTGTFDQLMEVGCIQAEMPALLPMFVWLMQETGKNPCKGCPIYDDRGANCKAFQQYHTSYIRAKEQAKVEVKAATTPSNVPAEHPLAGLSIRQIAAKLNISIGEVRRRKTKGIL